MKTAEYEQGELVCMKALSTNVQTACSMCLLQLWMSPNVAGLRKKQKHRVNVCVLNFPRFNKCSCWQACVTFQMVKAFVPSGYVNVYSRELKLNSFRKTFIRNPCGKIQNIACLKSLTQT